MNVVELLLCLGTSLTFSGGAAMLLYRPVFGAVMRIADKVDRIGRDVDRIELRAEIAIVEGRVHVDKYHQPKALASAPYRTSDCPHCGGVGRV